MKIFPTLFFTLFFGCGALFAQDISKEPQYPREPDKDAIFKAIYSADSPYRYNLLTDRYFSGDSTLTVEDYRHLYYGYVWQEGYQPFASEPAKDLLVMMFEKKDHTGEDYREIVNLASEVLSYDPFSPSNINFLIYAYGNLGDTVNERINYDRLRGIKGAILSSGTGLKESSPWHIIRREHAIDLMGSMGAMYREPMIVSSKVEYIPLLAKGSGGEKGYYFNFERIYWQRPDKMPEKRDTGWEFNGIPIKKR